MITYLELTEESCCCSVAEYRIVKFVWLLFHFLGLSSSSTEVHIHKIHISSHKCVTEWDVNISLVELCTKWVSKVMGDTWFGVGTSRNISVLRVVFQFSIFDYIMLIGYYSSKRYYMHHTRILIKFNFVKPSNIYIFFIAGTTRIKCICFYTPFSHCFGGRQNSMLISG